MVVLFLTEVFIQGLSPQPFSDATIELSKKRGGGGGFEPANRRIPNNSISPWLLWDFDVLVLL